MGLLFDLNIDESGELHAKCHREHIYTHGEDLEELHENIDLELTKAFKGRNKPEPSEIHFLFAKKGSFKHKVSSMA